MARRACMTCQVVGQLCNCQNWPRIIGILENRPAHGEELMKHQTQESRLGLLLRCYRNTPFLRAYAG